MPTRQRALRICTKAGRRLKLLGAAFILAQLTVGATQSEGQDQVRNFTQPILNHASRGHYAPVRELIFVPGAGSRLLSGGQDKVVHLWDLDVARSAPLRTIRPPLWRGLAGAIHGMALSPVADREGRRTLAVAGYGVEAARGNIVLYRFPGRDLVGSETGDVLGHLRSDLPDQVPPKGHSGLIFRLKFDPTGARLASAGDDPNVLVWDTTQRRVVTALGGHAKPVRGLAFLSGGRVVTGDGRGVVRLWDLAQPARPLAIGPTQPQATSNPEITDLAVSPDQKWVVVGREDALLIRLDAATLQQAVRLPTLPTQAAIRALVISHDGKHLATSIESERIKTPAELPRLDCDVELRSFPDGRVLSTLRRTDNQVLCCTFSEDDRRLAFAGDDRQTIRVYDTRTPAQPPIEFPSDGEAIREIGFGRDGFSLGYSRRPAGADNPDYEGFDLTTLRTRKAASGELDRAVLSYEGWTVTPVTPFSLRVTRPQGEGVDIALDPRRDGRWWSYTLLPPRKAGRRPLLAVTCTSGVSIHSLDENGRRTRFLAGHEGQVTTLAASRDGKWLATGSFDQTIRLWTLDGAEVVSKLGARYRSDGGNQVVDSVAPRSFADDMGLRAGDVLEICGIGRERVEPRDFVARADSVAPDVPLSIQVRERAEERGKGPVSMMTTKRHAPVLSLFVSSRPPGEWVLWTPQGYYDTSIAGDGDYLGWHLNQSWLDEPKPTAYYPIKQFQGRFYRKDILKKLLETADLNAALALANVVGPDPRVSMVNDRPPDVRAVVRETRGNLADLQIRAESPSGRDLKETWVRNGARLVQTIVHPRGTSRFEQTVQVPLEIGKNRCNITCIDTNDRRETRFVEVESKGIVAHPPRLYVVTVGAEVFQVQGAAPLLHAESDARDLAAFFQAHLVAPGQGAQFAQDQITTQVIVGSEARADRVLPVLDEVRARCRQKELGAGDLLIVAVESHVVSHHGRTLLLTSDSQNAAPPSPAIADDELGTALGEVAGSGCKVILLLDALHKTPTEDEEDAFKAWVRDLRDRRGVITLLASRTRASKPIVVNGHATFPRLRHRVFAQGVLDSTLAVRQTRDRMNAQGLYSLFGFQEAVSDNVRELTQGKQDTACYIPDLIPERFPLLNPR